MFVAHPILLFLCPILPCPGAAPAKLIIKQKNGKLLFTAIKFLKINSLSLIIYKFNFFVLFEFFFSFFYIILF